MNTFQIQATNNRLWNYIEFVDFLVKNQNKSIRLTVVPEAPCLESIGVFKLLDCFNFDQVTIMTENQLEKHPKYNIVGMMRKPYFMLEQRCSVLPNHHTWTKSKIFLAFYHRPTANRLGIASYLFLNCKDQSIIHFNTNPTDVDELQLYELNKLAEYRLQSLKDLTAMLDHLPIHVYDDLTNEHATNYRYSSSLGELLYKDILIDIAAETHSEGNTFYPTEKTARPMWFKKPFIMFGCRDSLAYLRQMGFQTFNDFWDEDYDGYDGANRFNRILKLIDNLSKKTNDELYEMYTAMQPVLEHNYTVLLKQTYGRKIKKVE